MTKSNFKKANDISVTSSLLYHQTNVTKFIILGSSGMAPAKNEWGQTPSRRRQGADMEQSPQRLANFQSFNENNTFLGNI